MCENHRQNAKELRKKLEADGIISRTYEGMVGDTIWASKGSRAYKITDLADDHLENIINRFNRFEEAVPLPLIQEKRRRLSEVKEVRLFFVTDSTEDNEEIFETLQEAEEYLKRTKLGKNPRIRICMVRNAYKEDNGGWNYDDYSDTFETVKVIKGGA